MTNVSDFQNAFTDLLDNGQQIRFRYFNVAYVGSYYDDDVTLTVSGNFWTSGIVLPISNTRGSSDAVLLEQGKILTNDTKLYVAGNIDTSGTWKLGLGSADLNTSQYSLLSEGVQKWDVNETPVLKKLYVRKILTGSMIGEVS